jgi:hypothetical protein
LALKMPARLVFKVQTEGKPAKPIDFAAYVFSRDGTFLTSVPVKAGAAEISIEEGKARGARVFFAPPLPEGQSNRAPTLSLMEKSRAYEASWTFDPKAKEYAILPIPEYNWKFWPFCSCRIRGHVVKPVTINAVSYDMPVCHARVHICEVDRFPILIERLPDPIILRLRDELTKLILKPYPPIPGPGPVESRLRINPNVAGLAPATTSELQAGVSSEMSSGSAEATPMAAVEQTSSNAAAFPDSMKVSLQSDSAPVLRQAFVENVDYVMPYFCIWEWFWPWWTCEEIAVVQTDGQGAFDATTWFVCGFEDTNLYFWVEYSVGGVWTTVYDPPLLCNTYWNYVCGSDVKIRLYDPRVSWCGDPPTSPGLSLTVLTIGNNVNVNQVDQDSSHPLYALTPDGRPFGGQLEPHVWFNSDALAGKGITHYRWSYRKADGLDSWHAMDPQIVRHYAKLGPGDTLSFLTYLLGPDPSAPFAGLNEFQIQQVAPPAGALSWAPQVDAREDTASAKFQTSVLDGNDPASFAGVYQLKLELFDGSANLVDLTTAGVELLVPPANQSAPFGAGTFTAVPAPSAYLLKDPNTGHLMGFTMMVHVDNNPCAAQIYPVSISGLEADPCGFLHYSHGSDVLVSFKAKHPNSFATFHFEIDLGSQGARPGTVDGTAGPNKTLPTPYTSDINSVFSGTVAVADLLDGCDQGAFAETLYVWAMATDGWGRLSGLDAGATPFAFALVH